MTYQNILNYLMIFDFPHKPEVLGMAIIDFDKKGTGIF